MKTLVTVSILVLTFGSVLVGSGSASAGPIQWSITPSPEAPGYHGLVGVSCLQPSMCMATGRDYKSTLFESWNGFSWTVMPSPTAPGRPLIVQGLSCATTTFCVAVGYDFGSSATQTVIETWAGKKWKVTPSPNVGGDYLYGVSCASRTFCVAVGRTAVSLDDDAPLILSWNGSHWSVDPNPSVNGRLSGISCISPAMCIAAGFQNTTGGDLLEEWTGTGWALMQGAAVASTELTSISCADAKDCMAVGLSFVSQPSSDIATFAEAWNGSMWAVTPTPDATEYQNELDGVSCTSGQNCVGVGLDLSQSFAAPQTMIESWNGAAWSLSSSPDHGQQLSNSLAAVSCADTNDCVAVGFFTN
jgi:hypothetical protein